MARIDALPVELLLRIFIEVPLKSSHFTSNTDGLVRLGRVCRLWRDILYDTASRALWSNFTLDVAKRKHYKIEDLLALSGEAPLDIVVESPNWRLYRPLEAESARLRTLIVQQASRFDRLCPILKAPLPLLEELALPDHGTWEASEDTWSEVDLSSSAPRLMHLHLSSYVALAQVRWPFSQITVLELTNTMVDGIWTAETQVDVITKFPNLVELCDTTLWDDPVGDAMPRTANFPHLKKLTTKIVLLRWLTIYAPKLEEFEPHGDIFDFLKDCDMGWEKRLHAPFHTLVITRVNASGMDSESENEETKRRNRYRIRIKDANIPSTIPPKNLLPFVGIRIMHISHKDITSGISSWLYALRVGKDSGVMPDLETIDIAFPEKRWGDYVEKVERAVLKLVESRVGGSLRRLRFTYLYDSDTRLPTGYLHDRLFRRQLEALQERAEGFEFELATEYYEDDWAHFGDKRMEVSDSDEDMPMDKSLDKEFPGGNSSSHLYNYDPEDDWY